MLKKMYRVGCRSTSKVGTPRLLFLLCAILLTTSGVSAKRTSEASLVSEMELSPNASATDEQRSTQEKKKVSGVVKDKSGEVLIGVSIVVKDTQIATLTDVDGKYTLTDVPTDAVLVISYLGHTSQEISVGSQSEINCTLAEDNLLLDEVVVIGYGTLKKRDLTGAIAQVKGDDIAHLPLRSASDALQGKAAGVVVTSTSGSPGSMGTVRIRGTGTINNNDPLFVVDGLPQTNVGWLNPSDIANMEVLKDASAQAIYGSRAANGVILITTKKGTANSEGGSEIQFDMNIGFQNIVNRPKMLDAEGFIKFKNLAYQNATPSKPLISDFESPEKVEQILTFLGKNGGRSGTDWWKEITRTGTDAPIQNYNLSFTGGNKKNQYRTSFGYMGHDGIVKGTDYSRITGRVNLDNQIKEWFKLSTNVAVIYEERGNVHENESFTGTIFSAMTADPITPVYRNNLVDIPDFLYDRIMNGYEPLNKWSHYTGVIYSNKPNVVSQTDMYDINKWRGVVTKANVAGDLKLFPFLTFRSSIALDLSRGKSSGFHPKYYLDGDEKRSDARAQRDIYETDYWVFDNYLTFIKDFGKHSINAMVGISAEKNRYEYIMAAKEGHVTNDENLHIINSGTKNMDAGGYHSIKTMNSYFGRIFYSYDNKYLLTANMRRDGSSNFADGKRWGTFPSVSVGWNFNEESFLKNQAWLSQGKLRAAWGEIGNENIDAGAYRNTYGNGGYFYTPGGALLSGGRSQVGNPELKWETTRQLDFGLDLAFLNGSLRTSFDYYERDTKDMLVKVPVPSLIGLPNTPWVNAGSVNNRGFEVTVEYNGKVNSDFSYSISANMSTNRNRVKKLGGTNIPGTEVHQGGITYTMIEPGQPIGYYLGLKTDGIFQTQSEIDSYVGKNGKPIMPDAEPGDLKFVDVNGDGVVDADDRVKIGNPHPSVTYGFTLAANYKGFDISAFFQGVAGNDVLNIMKLDLYQSTGWYNAPSDIFEKAWHGPNTSNEFFRINADQRRNHTPSDWLVESGSYLRLKNLNVGYTLPNNLTSKWFLRDVRVFVAAQNLFTVTPYSGFDPEMGNANPRYMGVDQGWYPQARTFMFGLGFKL